MYKLSAVVAAAVAVIGISASAPVSATVFMIDNFQVIKNGGTLFNDPFSDGLPPPDTSGQTSSFTCPTPTPCYATLGALSETGGRAVMDTEFGAFSNGPTGRAFQTNGAVLLSNRDPGNLTLGLKNDDTFSVRGLFDLTMPVVDYEAYGIRLTDRVTPPGIPTNPGNDVVELVVRRDQNTHDVHVQLRQLDYAGGTVILIDDVLLSSVLSSGDDQILLTLTRDSTSSNDITASFELFDGGVGGGVNTFDDTASIFSDENWTRAQFLAYTPAPEPASLALLGLGLAGLSMMRRRRLTA